MPVRLIPKNYRNVTGIHSSSKSEDRAMFESTLERDFITTLELLDEVSHFEVQPVKIEWVDDNGKNRSYTPDVLYSRKTPSGNEKILVEVKYRSDLKKDWIDLKPKFKAAIRFAKSQGWKFKIMTEIEIRTPFLKNAKFLRPFLREGARNEGDMTLIDGKLKELKQSTPNDLLVALASNDWDKAVLLPTLWYLVATNQIAADLINHELNMMTPIFWKP
ncbi:MAG: heteromeric transposase endonuclease subunit TnsA [Pseudomonadota bacterium]|nr:heteromeric transposase endonuclease subunit TnsA [Pseudomonadota bacterium]